MEKKPNSLFMEITLTTLKKKVTPYQIIRITEISASQPMIKSIYSNQLLSNSPATKVQKM